MMEEWMDEWKEAKRLGRQEERGKGRKEGGKKERKKERKKGTTVLCTVDCNNCITGFPQKRVPCSLFWYKNIKSVKKGDFLEILGFWTRMV